MGIKGFMPLYPYKMEVEVMQLKLQFVPIKTRRTVNKTLVQRLTEITSAWDYIPSKQCIADTFNVSEFTAGKVFNNLIKIKGLPDWLRLQLHRRKGRSVLKKMLINIQAPFNVSLIDNLPLEVHEPTIKEQLIYNIKKKVHRKQLKITDVPVIDLNLDF